MYKRKWLPEFIILFFITVIRVVPALIKFSFGNDTPVIGADIDPQLYFAGARWIIEGDVAFKDTPPTFYYPPLNFIFIAAILFFSKGNIILPVCAMILLGLLTVAGVYLLAEKSFGRKTACLAACIYGLYPNAVFFGITFYSENLAILCMVFSFYMIVRYFQTRDSLCLLPAGVLLSLASLTRGGVHYFILFIAFVIGLHFKPGERKHALRPVLVLVLCVYGTIVSAALIIYPITNGFFLDAKNGIATVIQGANPIMNPCVDYGNVNSVFFDINNVKENWPPGTPEYNDTIARMKSWEFFLFIGKYIASNPGKYMQHACERLSFFWSPNEYVLSFIKYQLHGMNSVIPQAASLLIVLSYLALMSGALLGIGCSRDMLRSLFIAFVIFNCMLVFVTTGNTRYRLQLIPFFSIYCAYFISLLSGARGVVFRNRLSKFTVLMLIAALWINGAYRYWNEIYPSPQEIQVRKIEFCNQIGFPKTTLVLLQQNRYEYTKTQLERLKRAEAAAQKKVSAAPAAK